MLSKAKRMLAIFVLLMILASSNIGVWAEDSLETILDNVGFPNRVLTTVETFSAGTYNITLYAEIAGYHASNNLSWYKVSTTNFNLIFDGPEGGHGYITPPVWKTFTTDSQFGLSFWSPDLGGHRFYSETVKNSDGTQHVKVYQNLDDTSMFLIGFENFYGGGDMDYNDMVFSLKFLSPPPSPPPPVGGVWVPINKTELLAPWISLASLVTVATASIVYVKRRKKQQN